MSDDTECDYVRVQLVEGAIDGRIVRDKKIDVWNGVPQQRFGLADGSQWERLDYTSTLSDGEPMFVVVVRQAIDE